MVREDYPEVVTSVGLELALHQAGDAGEIWVGRRRYSRGRRGGTFTKMWIFETVWCI